MTCQNMHSLRVFPKYMVHGCGGRDTPEMPQEGSLAMGLDNAKVHKKKGVLF